MLRPDRFSKRSEGSHNLSGLFACRRPGWRRDLAWYVMLAPYMLGLVGLVFAPALLSLGLAFTHYDALSPPAWCGLANLELLARDRFFWMALGNTLLYLALAVPLRVVGALALALLFLRRGRGLVLARTLIYLPAVIPDIAYALIWLVALNPRYGPVNGLLGTLGLPTPAWLVEPWPARLALAFITVWQLGEGFVVLLASLNDIPTHLYEAAVMDGAGAWACLRWITLPLLLPRLTLLTARDIIVSLQANFTPSLVMTHGGGPGYATLFLPLYAYILAFDDFRLGYAASVVWTLYAITVLVVGVMYGLGRHWHYEGGYEA